MALVLVLLVGVPVFPALAQSDIKVTLDGVELTFEVPPQTIGGRTMVPMRAIFEALGADVKWEGSTQTITGTKDGRVVVMQLDNTTMTINGRAVTLDVPPQVVRGRTLVPVRAISEGLDLKVNWDSGTRTVVITQAPQGPAQLLAARPATDATLGILFGYGNSRLNEVQFDTRYFFEQFFLPIASYDAEEEVIELLKESDLEELEDFVMYFWAYIAAFSVIEVLDEIGDLVGTETDEYTYDLISERVIEYGLSYEQHILDMTIEAVGGGSKALILTMAEPGWAMLSTYIGLVYIESVGLQVYTLERSIGDGVYMFSRINADESRETIAPIENNKSGFIRIIEREVQALRS